MGQSLETLLAQGHLALVLCEVQESVIGEGAPWPALTEATKKVGLVENAVRLAEAARRHGAPVIHCTAENLTGRFGGNVNARLFGAARKVMPDARRDPRSDRPIAEVWGRGDILLPRYHGVSPMTGSPLDALLRNHGITTLILAGVSVSFAILNLTMDAINRAYQVILPTDAVAGFPEHYAKMVMANTLSMLATTATTADILGAWQD